MSAPDVSMSCFSSLSAIGNAGNMNPYTMCTEQECRERLESHEISIFERTSRDGPPDPRKIVAKYRRSAAGSKQRTPRSIQQLKTTVHYLINFLFQTPHQHLLPAVNFFEDRIRAVQVDLTRIHDLSSGAELQVLMARAQIIVLYLTTSMDKQEYSSRDRYERRFGLTALQTALSAYFASLNKKWGDEMTMYSILNLLNERLHSDAALEASGEAPSLSFRSVWMETTRLTRCYGHFGKQTQWALRLLSRVCLGEWQQGLVQVTEPTASTLARCCIDDRARGYLRWKTLQSFNLVLSKGQTIDISEVGRLLCIYHPTPLQTAEFVSTFGLPQTDDKSKLIFKQSAILPPTDLSRCMLSLEALHSKEGESILTEACRGLAPLVLNDMS